MPDLDNLIEQLGEDRWSVRYWDSIYVPLRTAVIRGVQKHFSFLPSEDAADAADEVILRLFKTFDFNRLASAEPNTRPKIFRAFVKKTVWSVVLDIQKQRGLLQPPESKPRYNKAIAAMRGAPVDLVTRSLFALKPGDQEILRQKLFQKLEYDEIAQARKALGRPATIGALKMQFKRASEALKKNILELSLGGPK